MLLFFFTNLPDLDVRLKPLLQEVRSIAGFNEHLDVNGKSLHQIFFGLDMNRQRETVYGDWKCRNQFLLICYKNVISNATQVLLHGPL